MGVNISVFAATITETSLNFFQTKRSNIPEDIHLPTLRRDNLKP
jgi:hypothetical protein